MLFFSGKQHQFIQVENPVLAPAPMYFVFHRKHCSTFF